MRDRYVLQVLLATFGCGLLMALIAVGDARLDNVGKPESNLRPNAAAPYAAESVQAKSLPVPSASEISPTVPEPQMPHSRANADPTFYVIASRPTGKNPHRCPYEDSFDKDGCKQGEAGKPGQTKRC